MGTEIVSSYLNNTIKNFILPTELNEYISYKQEEYLKELFLNKFENLPGRKLELITAVEKIGLIYEDVPKYIKKEYNLPNRDEGIDVIKLDDDGKIKACFQCKDFDGYVSHHCLGTFYSFKVCNEKFKDIPFICIGSITTKFPSGSIFELYDVDNYIVKDHQNTSETNEMDNNEEPKKMHPLRQYQLESIEHIEAAIKDRIPNIRIKLPCGTGKTNIIYHYCTKYYNTDKQILILVSKINIAEQIQKKLKEFNINVDTYWTNVTPKEHNSNITLAVYNSVRNIHKLNIEENQTLDFNTDIEDQSFSFDMIFIDEAHHILGSELYSKYKDKIDFIKADEEDETYLCSILNLKSIITVYLSATIDIESEYDYEYSMDQAIKDKYLCDYEIDMCYVSNDNREQELIRIINENKEYKHIIIFCNKISTANKLNIVLNQNNILSSVLTGKTKTNERNLLLESFKNGNLKVICSVNCLNEGTDLPIADTAIFYDNRRAEINIIQCIGRVLRLHEFKTKGKIVLLDNNSKNCEKICNYYLKAINKVDKYFQHKIDDIYNCYRYETTQDESSTKQITEENPEDKTIRKSIRLNQIEDKYFQKIIRTRLTFEDRFESCQRFYQKYQRMPKTKEPLWENWNIGDWIHKNMKLRPDSDPEKIQLEELFKRKLEIKKHFTYDEKIRLCGEYYERFHIIPHKINLKYKGLTITNFINYVIRQNYKDYILKLEDIFEAVLYKNQLVNKNDLFRFFNTFEWVKINKNNYKRIISDFIFYRNVLAECINRFKFQILLEFNRKFENTKGSYDLILSKAYADKFIEYLHIIL